MATILCVSFPPLPPNCCYCTFDITNGGKAGCSDCSLKSIGLGFCGIYLMSANSEGIYIFEKGHTYEFLLSYFVMLQGFNSVVVTL